ncbi:MAG TPA: sialate O-acetylesterase [Armatimonadota bacterium]|jgi:sialate O-acetylesterase
MTQFHLSYYGQALVTLALLVLGATLATADLTLPSVIGDHMIIQQGIPAPIWGKAAPGEQVTVSYAGQTKHATADAEGRWMVKLDPVTAQPGQRGRMMRIAGRNSQIVLRDLMVGEVWVCSGQSNMQFATVQSINGEAEVAQANYPQMRLFTVPNVTAPFPQENCGGQWLPCSPQTAAGFSAVGYFFGRDLFQNLGVPIGLINTSWGGTVAEAWTSAAALRAKLPEFNAALDIIAGPQDAMTQATENYRKQVDAFNAATLKLYDMEEDVASATAGRARADYDDKAWKQMPLPADYRTVLGETYGLVWFRKTVDIPAAWAGKDLILRPGPIDEVDVTWFNGVEVGAKGNSRARQTQYWNVAREYKVPGNLVKAGPNVIAIRVSNIYGQGGLWGQPGDTMFVQSADNSDKTHVSLVGNWRYDVEFKLPVMPADPNNPNRPSMLYNAMIAPLIPVGIRGAIWYQGESNAGNATQYRTLLPTMITDWRTRWGEGDFPFLVVSLANYTERLAQPQDSQWAELREAQALTAERYPKVGLAMAIDIGDAADIHPKNKQEVGRRLALDAEAMAYGEKVVYSGPVFRSLKVEGGKAVLSFSHVEGGLVAKGGPLTGFAIAGADGKFVWAKAEIRGSQIVVWSDQVAAPAAVRYAWANNPECNLYNGAGLPAVPFRTNPPAK